jgi:transcriptional regulator with XRE-family HTH domain
MGTVPPSHDFAVRLRDALSARGISRKEFAAMVDVSQNTVTNWATGRYRPDHWNLVRIASALEMTLDELHGDSVPMATPDVTPAGLRGDTSPPPDAADQIIRDFARLDLDAPLEALRGAAPDLMRLLADARRYAARERS